MTSRTILKPLRKLALACTVAASMGLTLSGCKDKPQGDGAPPPAKVIQVPDMNLITIDSKDASKFPLAAAEKIEASSELNATGSVLPDISREVPVISLANGRVVDIKAASTTT
jgi:cobalt-zinc-cadmium efflux system membrane fusion protein